MIPHATGICYAIATLVTEEDEKDKLTFHAVRYYEKYVKVDGRWWIAELEGYDFGGKTIIPYCTHEGSGMGHSESDLKKLCPSATMLQATPIHGADVEFADREVNRIISLMNY